VAKPTMMAAQWRSQNLGPIFAGCRPKLTKLSIHVREWS